MREFAVALKFYGQQNAEKLLGTINSLTLDEAAFVDKCCNWTKAKNWAEWWLRPKHLQMLYKDFFIMHPSVWNRSPSTTNTVERLNAECKSKLPVTLQHALSNMYRLNKSVCAKYLAGLKECSISYCEKTESVKCQYYRKCDSNASLSKLYKAPKESMLGRKLMMKFNVNHKPQWFKGIVNAYDGLTGKYGVYFPCDKQTVYIQVDDKDQIL